MSIFRKTMFLAILSSFLLQLIVAMVPPLFSVFSDQPPDDLQYRYVAPENNQVSYSDLFQNLPYYLLMIWIALEFLKCLQAYAGIVDMLVLLVILGVITSVSGPMISSITDQGIRSAERSMSYAVGGAKDIDNFRENLAAGYLPKPSDITYEGLFYGYSFKIGEKSLKNNSENRLFRPLLSRAVCQHPLDETKDHYLALGLASDLKGTDFARKKLNLVVVLDISYSMSSSFNQYHYGGKTRNKRMSSEEAKMSKLESACRSIVAMLDHLKPDDRLGIVLFDHEAHLAKPVALVKNTQMENLKQHIMELQPAGGTNMEQGMTLGEELLKPFAYIDKNEFENRMVFLTDAMPNTDDISESGLLGMTRKMSENGIYLSFIGMGVDFNTELVEAITKVRGANYYSVHSPAEFTKRLAEEFDYMVTPMIFDLTMELSSEDFCIEKVIGSPDADLQTGRIMQVRTLFPSASEEDGGKGSIILVKLLKKDSGHEKIKIKISYKDRNGNSFAYTDETDFSGIDAPFYEDTDTRKAILLANYADLIKDVATRKYPIKLAQADTIADDGSGWSHWERPGRPLKIGYENINRIDSFLEHLNDESLIIGDTNLNKERKLLENLLAIVGK
jgi:Ca-activated chloride channel family protein